MTMISFEEAVREYLIPHQDSFNYEEMYAGHVDISRFFPWVQQVDEYRSVEGATVLSSGCGSAGDLMAFMEKGALRAVGIELDPGLVSLARHRFSGTRHEGAVEIDCYDGKSLPYDSNIFDIVFSMHVIEHTQDPAFYLLELFRVLRPGGVLFLDVPNRFYWKEQHTDLPLINLPPMKWRNGIISFLLREPWGSRLSGQTRFKLATLRNFHLPAPHNLIALYKRFRGKYSLDLLNATFHNYSGWHVDYGSRAAWLPMGQLGKMTTFRMVVTKPGAGKHR